MRLSKLFPSAFMLLGSYALVAAVPASTLKEAASSNCNPSHVRNAILSKVCNPLDVTCTFSITEEETETCWYVSYNVRCTGEGMAPEECFLTISACDDGNGGVIISSVGGCASS